MTSKTILEWPKCEHKNCRRNSNRVDHGYCRTCKAFDKAGKVLAETNNKLQEAEARVRKLEGEMDDARREVCSGKTTSDLHGRELRLAREAARSRGWTYLYTRNEASDE